MRTTLDIDDDVLQAAKELARGEGKTAGKVISDLARKALTAPLEGAGLAGPAGAELIDGWYVLPTRGGIVTNETVERLLDEADREDAGFDEGR